MSTTPYQHDLCQHYPVLGRTDHLDFPELGLINLPVKIDTGARTSALHCSHIEHTPGADPTDPGKVQVVLLDKRYTHYTGQQLELPCVAERWVRSSNGQRTLRRFVRTEVLVYGRVYRILFSLVDRSSMKFPVLLGERFLKRRFLIDLNQKDCSRQYTLQVG